ncbi:MAG: family transposase [Ferruginibacter sp.]|nr:family transposase [Ferruginibacter sp.]
MSRQAFYDAQKQEQKTSIAQMIVLCLVREIRSIMPMLGTRKLVQQLETPLNEHGIKMGRDQLFELLRFHGLLIRRRRRMVKTTDSHHWLKKYPNLTIGLDLNEAEQLWVSDITYIRTLQGFSYLSLITDAFSRKVVGHCLYPTLEAIGCLEALVMALQTRNKECKLIHHSDRGIQYCSAAYVEKLNDHNVGISMTQSGSPYENALAERMNGILKNEFYPRRIYQNHKEAKKVISSNIEIYNKKRPHASLDYLTPDVAHGITGPINKKWKTYPKRNKNPIS